jgi:RNA polymerase sigma-70 factor (ECF subfamily)
MHEKSMRPTRISEDQLEHLMVEGYADLLHLAFSIVHHQAEAEDATQLALERAWRYRTKLRDVDSAIYWLRRIVVRETLRRQSKNSRWAMWPHVAEIEFPGRAADDPAHNARADLLGALAKLSPEQSAVIVLHHYFGYSVPEVADITGAPPETVRSRLRLAMGKLRQELQDDQDDR